MLDVRGFPLKKKLKKKTLWLSLSLSPYLLSYHMKPLCIQQINLKKVRRTAAQVTIDQPL